MTYTRAASAASSHRAKQELVRLLFGPQMFRQGREAHKKLDHSIYTHSQLKSAYLERIQQLHPDKRRNNNQHVVAATLHRSENDEFISLREAWSRYEEFSKALTKVDNGSREADFTLFGVGCSFSDNEAEREKRNEITDQACRGWFSAGRLGEGEEKENAESNEQKATMQQSSLLDEGMFIVDDKNENLTTTKQARKKSLIDHMIGKRG